ncbi:MAG TPA: hypothetical protein VNJ29_03020 [Candidatus Nitrosotenuis sp.]|jgi:hypothetical protein|nr:hypothetical protein [Candidatus Nitrosotenuis sp.]
MFLKKFSLYSLTVFVLQLNSAHGSDSLEEKNIEPPLKSVLPITLPEKLSLDLSQQTKNIIKDNKGLVHHTASDIITGAARFIYPPLETLASPYRWISGCYMWYQNHEQLSLQPSALLNFKNYAILAHMSVDVAEYILASTPGLIDFIPGGDYIEGTLNAAQFLTYLAILGSTGLLIKQAMMPSVSEDKKEA